MRPACGGRTGITELFDSIQLIPASSGVDHSSAQKDKAHFPAIHRETGVPYSGMLFFDDESPNITKVTTAATAFTYPYTSRGCTLPCAASTTCAGGTLGSHLHPGFIRDVAQAFWGRLEAICRKAPRWHILMTAVLAGISKALPVSENSEVAITMLGG